jgi:hypothetical protein
MVQIYLEGADKSDAGEVDADAQEYRALTRNAGFIPVC